MRPWRWLPVLLLVAAGCRDGTGPEDAARSVAEHDGDGQFGVPGAQLQEPLLVRVTDANTAAPLRGVSVNWQVVEGVGAALNPPATVTDSFGIARGRLTLGPDTGSYRVEASVARMQGSPARFTARAVLPPVIDEIVPAAAAAGDTVNITGTRFAAESTDNTVLFGGVRGTVVHAENALLRVVVPACVPERDLQVTVRLGPVASEPRDFAVTGDPGPTLSLGVGEILHFAAAGQTTCLRFPNSADAQYLLVPQNAGRASIPDLRFQLLGLTGPTDAVADWLAASPPGRPADFGAEWESLLRERERAIAPADLLPSLEPDLDALGPASVPAVGHRREFNVVNLDFSLRRITAEVKYVSDRAIIYEDLDAPANGFGPSDYEQFAKMFDDPIYATMTEVFGAPSDIDGNGRVIMLFTPAVNAMSPRGSDGFIAGFFYGLDLTTQSGSNRAEIFYSVVPDPNGQFSDPRPREPLMRIVPPVLAHEFQHMIHFYHRWFVLNAGNETHWMMEALAHMAEDIVADEWEARGQPAVAADFRESNRIRARRYLAETHNVSIIAPDPPGTLAERGGQWLFLKYLMGHYGDRQLVRALTRTSRRGVANVEAETGRTWAELMRAWSVALWADGEGEITGQIDPVYTFTNFDVRAALSQNGSFPLQPRMESFQDFLFQVELPGTGSRHVVLSASAQAPRLNVVYSAPAGADFDPTQTPDPRLSILRLR